MNLPYVILKGVKRGEESKHPISYGIGLDSSSQAPRNDIVVLLGTLNAVSDELL